MDKTNKQTNKQTNRVIHKSFAMTKPMPMPRRPRLPTPETYLQGAVPQVQVRLADADGCDAKIEAAPPVTVDTSTGQPPRRKRGWSLFEEMEQDDATSVLGRTTSTADDSSVTSFDLFTSSPKRDERRTKRTRTSVDYLQDSVLTFSSEVTPENSRPEEEPSRDTEDSVACSNILHITCLYFPHDAQAIETALRACPPKAPQVPIKLPQSEYSFPLHIALSQYASQSTGSAIASQLVVVTLLASAAPFILGSLDGPPGEEVTPLALAVSLGLDTQIVRLLLQADSSAASRVGSTDDLPLHYACQVLATATSSSSLDTIPMLLQCYPAAVRHRNQRGQTPLDILLQQPNRSHRLSQAILYLVQHGRETIGMKSFC